MVMRNQKQRSCQENTSQNQSNQQSHRRNANSTNCTKEEDKLLSRFQHTKVYLIQMGPGHNEEKGTRKERAQQGQRRAKEKMSQECRRK